MPRTAAVKTPRTATAAPAPRKGAAGRAVVDLQTYAPAYFTWIANKLSGGASQAYLAAFGVGIETWRLLVLLAIEPAWSAKRICDVIGMDKASVSRAFKTMQAKGLITIGLDEQDGRLRVASITSKGREVHDKILGIALDRERALLSALNPEERQTLIRLLRKVHDNLPAVEEATHRYLSLHYPHAARKRWKRLAEE